MVTIQVMTTKQATSKKIKSRGLEKLAIVISNMNDTVFMCVSEAHAFYPRRILTAAVHGASREHGRERLLALFSSSNRRLSPVRGGSGGGGCAGDYIRDGSFLPR